VDSLQAFLQEKGVFCYRIEAVYDISVPGYQASGLSSWSNVQCIIHRPIIYIPNAFAPNGVNTIFKPTIIYGDPKGYVMIIYNRWGGKVFESNDPAIGWDGTDHGAQSPQGGYAYFIQFQADDGVIVERQGVVLLVR
jgi:gliding motility-associated-like protein